CTVLGLGRKEFVPGGAQALRDDPLRMRLAGGDGDRVDAGNAGREVVVGLAAVDAAGEIRDPAVRGDRLDVVGPAVRADVDVAFLDLDRHLARLRHADGAPVHEGGVRRVHEVVGDVDVAGIVHLVAAVEHLPPRLAEVL